MLTHSAGRDSTETSSTRRCASRGERRDSPVARHSETRAHATAPPETSQYRKALCENRISIRGAAKPILAAPARFRRIAHRLRTKPRPHDLLHTSTRGRHRGTRRARTICVNRSDLRPHSRRQTSCTDIRRTPENRSPEGLVHRIPDPRPVSASEATGKGRTAPTECVAVRMLCW